MHIISSHICIYDICWYCRWPHFWAQLSWSSGSWAVAAAPPLWSSRPLEGVCFRSGPGGTGIFRMIDMEVSSGKCLTMERSTILNGKTHELSTGPWLQWQSVSHYQLPYHIRSYFGSAVPSHSPSKRPYIYATSSKSVLYLKWPLTYGQIRDQW